MDNLLQIIIVICLLVVIFLLAVDKVKIVRTNKPLHVNQDEVKLPEIMGKTRRVIEDHRLVKDKISDRKFITAKTTLIAPPQEDQENHLESQNEGERSAFQVEEEFPPYDDRFSQGVSLEELMTVGKLLQQDDLESVQQNSVIDVMQKIQGTELYSLLENSIEGASERIAALLDKTLERDDSNGINPRESNIDNFDIGNFI